MINQTDAENQIFSFAKTHSSAETRKEIGRVFGLKKSARNRKFNRMFGAISWEGGERDGEKVVNMKMSNGDSIKVGKPKPEEKIRGVKTPKVEVKGDKATVEVKDALNIKTVDDLLSYAQIDLTEWNVVKQFVNVWDGKYQVKAELARKVPQDIKIIIENTKKELKSYSPCVAPIHSPSVENNDLMLELVLADVHLGRLCWPGAGEDNYSLKIARDLVFGAVHDMTEKAKRFGSYSKVVLWIGGDYLNVDNEENTTTALTSQSVDSRFPKVFKEGKEILVEVINYLKNIAPVDVIITRGNHDFNSMFHMGEVIEAYFHNDSNVRVDNSPAPRKYYKFGQNLIQFCHGDKIDLKKLPSIMAAEAASDWGQTKWHECHTAHRHHEKLIVDESAQCKTRVMNTIAGVDGYHATHGYVQNIRCAQSFIWSKDFGLQCLVYSDPIQ
jgi:hypothetical protein